MFGPLADIIPEGPYNADVPETRPTVHQDMLAIGVDAGVSLELANWAAVGRLSRPLTLQGWTETAEIPCCDFLDRSSKAYVQASRTDGSGLKLASLVFNILDLDPNAAVPVWLSVAANSAEMISGMISAELALARVAEPQTNSAVHGGRTATTSDPSGSRLVICLAWFWVTPATGSVIG